MSKDIDVYLVNGVYQSMDDLSIVDKTTIKAKEAVNKTTKFISSNILNIVAVTLVIVAAVNAYIDADI